MFSKLMESAIESHFKKDQSGRLVFIPFSLKGKCYFVDSKSDEEKTRAFVKMFRSAMQLISWLTFPSLLVPGLILENVAGLTPRAHRLKIALGIPLFFWMVLAALAFMLWGLYRQAVPRFTASLSEVAPEVKEQLREISRPRQVALAVFVACAGSLMFTAGK
jgi:hypothetical protein